MLGERTQYHMRHKKKCKKCNLKMKKISVRYFFPLDGHKSESTFNFLTLKYKRFKGIFHYP